MNTELAAKLTSAKASGGRTLGFWSIVYATVGDDPDDSPYDDALLVLNVAPMAQSGDPQALKFMADFVYGPHGMASDARAWREALVRCAAGSNDKIAMEASLELAAITMKALDAMDRGAADEARLLQEAHTHLDAALRRPAARSTRQSTLLLHWLASEAQGEA